MHAGTPQNIDSYLIADLQDFPFYVHKDLVDWKIEIYWIGIENVGKLAARQY